MQRLEMMATPEECAGGKVEEEIQNTTQINSKWLNNIRKYEFRREYLDTISNNMCIFIWRKLIPS